MNRVRRQRLFLLLFLVTGAGVAVSLTLFALQQNINLFYSPTQIANGQAPIGQTIRIGGLVVPGSVSRDSQSLRVQFSLTDEGEQITVHYDGILPDLFREGQGIVALGRLQPGGIVQAQEVLAKHDENYMPPEVAEALKQSGKWQHAGSN